METFKYKNIDLSKRKQYMLDAWKLMFRRPLYSFASFFLLTFLCFFVGTKIANISSALIFILFMSLFIVPIIAFEMSYSNENSTIPFRNFNYKKSKSFIYVARYFSLEIFLSIVIFTVSMLGNTTKGEQSNSNSVEIIFLLKVLIYIFMIGVLSYCFAYLFRAIYIYI